MTNENYQAPAEFGRWQNIALGLGAILSLIVLGAAAFFPEQREQALRGWLLGFIFWGGIGIGSIGILLLQYLTGGAWGVVIRRVAEAASRTLPVIVVLFLPLLFGVHSLYDWATPEGITNELVKHAVEHRGSFQTPMWWGIRAALYFLLWGIMVYLLNKWSLKQDQAKDYEESAALLGQATAFSGPTMVFFVLLVTFAAVDWVMSLDASWFSTIWGLLFVAGWALSCFSFSVIILAWLSERAPMNRVLGKRHFHDIGKLMLALVMVWAYFNFSQFLIIWSGNLPEETTFYLTRTEGGWGVLGVLLIIFHFAFPFVILLSREIKRRPKWLARLAIFILFVRLTDMFYLIEPSPLVGQAKAGGFHFSWFDIVAPLAVGGIWLWFFFVQLQKRPLVPVKDPFLENAIEHGGGH